MRLGIRRKLIGTLMLVGLFPLALSLIVILGGDAALQLRTIHGSYENGAVDCANQLTSSAREEFDKLILMARLPLMVEYVRDHSEDELRLRGNPGAAGPTATPADLDIEARWSKLRAQDEPLRSILNSPLAERFRIVASLDSRRHEMLATDVFGRVIAANHKTGNYTQCKEGWWLAAYHQGHGRPYMSSITTNPATGLPCVEFVVPIYDDRGDRRLLGVLKDKVDLDWIGEPLRDVAGRLDASSQLYDVAQAKPVYPLTADALMERSAKFYEERRGTRDGDTRPHFWGLITRDLVVGSGKVPLDERLGQRFANVVTPKWVVLIARPSNEAMVNVYRLAVLVALIGAALILVLFVLGVAIANREIIMPVIRLREATAAVGRGELNVRLVSDDHRDPTFRTDELGELARDFDEMTRQLQRNVNALARSNEAKRRFMELAGHELRTPVTYILSACQLAQRQLQQLLQQGEVGDSAVATAGKTTAQVAGSMAKIAAKAQRLSRIIDNLLKLVNSDQFVTRLNKTAVDVRALILQVAADARPFLLERKQQLTLDVPENLPSFEGDRDKLEDVLTNLVSNAIRFSPDGGTIKIAAHPTVGDMLEILIADSGAGIPQQDLANLFEPFYTGSDVLHHHSGEHEYRSKGIGLGLAIVRRFVEIHGGIVRAQSTGHGTQFQILLPLGKDIIPNPPGPEGPVPGDGL